MTATNTALEFNFAGDALAQDIERIHLGTAIYTAVPEIEALLDRLDWPNRGTRLLDPGAGNGGFLVSALARLDLAPNDITTAAHRVRGYEFHPGAAAAARAAIKSHLQSRGWNPLAAGQAAAEIIEIKDFLLSPVPTGTFDVIAANPPYWRLANLPPESQYRVEYERAVPPHVRADLLYAYLQRAVDVVAHEGHIGLITADRWLLNSGSAELRQKIGDRYTVTDIQRLESSSCFYRPKARTKGSPARVHPVSLVLSPRRDGRELTSAPFRIEDLPVVDGKPLTDLATIRLAPWLGPDGIFVVDDPAGLPSSRLIPCVEPEDLNVADGTMTPRRWAIATDRSEPEPEVVAHIRANYAAMPKRGQRTPDWLPPEPFSGKLPLTHDAILIPRIAKRLTPIRLPAGTMPINHNLVVIAGIAFERLAEMLNHPEVQAQADALSLRLENGYRSYTATLLRQLIIPHSVI